ncbi:hypothetical protein IFM89_015255 [Coptis chinensis]|uniref:NADPH oxidase Respiratory burst domain-containing protein n=1 Tax=Coptis chinensis TaxID=261450 RepID=A0A835HEP5_9MAGN|nr:hypothetical protein IFM89_015255 [Coptis chinensis]
MTAEERAIHLESRRDSYRQHSEGLADEQRSLVRECQRICACEHRATKLSRARQTQHTNDQQILLRKSLDVITFPGGSQTEHPGTSTISFGVDHGLELNNEVDLIIHNGNEDIHSDDYVKTGLSSSITSSIYSKLQYTSVEPATSTNHDGNATDTPMSSKPSTMKRTSSSKLLNFSQELKAEAITKAKQFSQELKAEFQRKFSRNHTARALRRQRAEFNRTQKALKGLRFISSNAISSNGANGWNDVENNFDKLSKDEFLYRSDFAQCIGMRDSKEFALELFDALGRRR